MNILMSLVERAIGKTLCRWEDDYHIEQKRKEKEWNDYMIEKERRLEEEERKQ